MAGLIAFVRELRRRRVFRGAVLYVVGAWVVLQVADVIAEPAGLPPWTMTALLYIAAIGFPVAVFLGWRYEIGEHGLVRTAPARAVDAVELSLQRSDYVFVGIAGGFRFMRSSPSRQLRFGSSCRAPSSSPNNP